jgi:PPOX class probable F420-dependent enzyme
MPSKRDQIRMTDDEVRAFLEAGRDLQVASINRDGTPHLVTMWYVVDDDGEIAFWTFGKSQKVQNLRRDPRITVLVATGDTYDELKGVSISGRAEVIDEYDDVVAYGLRVHGARGGAAGDDAVPESVAAQARKRVVIVVKPEKVVTWDHTKLGGGY